MAYKIKKTGNKLLDSLVQKQITKLERDGTDITSELEGNIKDGMRPIAEGIQEWLISEVLVKGKTTSQTAPFAVTGTLEEK